MSYKTKIPKKHEIEKLIEPYDFNMNSSKNIDVQKCIYGKIDGFLVHCRWFSFMIPEPYIPMIITECCYQIGRCKASNDDESDNRVRVKFDISDSELVKIRIFGPKYESIIPLTTPMITERYVARDAMIHTFDKFTIFVEELLVELYTYV